MISQPGRRQSENNQHMNLGNAKIEGLDEELQLDGVKYNIALCIFFIPYILFGMKTAKALPLPTSKPSFTDQTML